ncbi:MAG: DUF3153 domain-containing protein [Elainellaceae cyanobacterium]
MSRLPYHVQRGSNVLLRPDSERRSLAQRWFMMLPRGFRAIARGFLRLRLLWIILLASLCLSGCVQYDVGIVYADQHHGKIIQHITLAERLTQFSGDVTQDWLESIRARTRDVGGRIQRVSDHELIATIPFNNGDDLTAKFNRFFQADSSDSQSADQSSSDLPDLSSQLSLHESNFLLVLRNRLTYEIDLRSLNMLASQGNLLINPGNLLTLTFSLTTPWGAHIADISGVSRQEITQQGQQIIWTLKPGVVNHLEIVFWIPSPLGMGTLIIIIVVVAGAFLRRQIFSSSPTAIESIE